MQEFTQSWAFAFLLGCIIGGCFGVVLAAILAASGRASRTEERIEKDIFRDDVPPYETPEEIIEKEKRKKAYLKMRGIIATKNDPRTD